jgi:hypothetical protein
VPVDVGVWFAHLIQKVYESFQIGPMEALNVRPQVLVTEKFVKEKLILSVGGVKLLKPFLGVRN